MKMSSAWLLFYPAHIIVYTFILLFAFVTVIYFVTGENSNTGHGKET